MSDLPSERDASTEALRLQVNAFDVADLRGLLGEVEVVEERPAGAHGEPVTLIVLAVTPLVVQAISLWLLKQRRKKEVHVKAEKVTASGERQTLAVTVKMSESTSQADVVEQVVTGMHWDPSLTKAVAGLGG